MRSLERTTRLAGALIIAGALSFTPAFAVDTGGSDTGSSSGSSSSSSSSTVEIPTLGDVRADIKASRWAKAIEKLKLIIADSPRSADAHSLMGYSLRKSGQLDRALQFYNKALQLNPKHTGALEYQGELFVQTGKISKAKENLAKLKTICGTSCEEYEDLAKAIGA